ncbi:hypothetical protein DFH09DRAFT_1451845 [Mycena vulgaris]|nr:hypothetical protein DFH09DRAFT_1451845 [Mycena vulgaris]
MVFGLFSRKPAQPPADALQLRTPSPSVVDSYSARVDDLGPPITPSPPPEDVTDPTALRALINSIPPKTLHAYTLAHLATAPPQTLTYLAAFFSHLTPPPTLHCVRCHKGFFDVENTDRSCLIGHDDDSAEVERVGKGAGSSYETLWGCCGKTVDGDGDMGPPRRLTDPKRARFRADSTPHDDKLASCARLRCHDPLGAATRKRTRRARAAAGADSDADSGADDDSDDDAASHSSVRTRSHKRARTGPGGSDDVDVDMRALPASPKSAARKPRARSVGAASTASTRVKPAKKPRSTAPKAAALLQTPSKKPASTRFAPAPTPLAPAASFTATSTSTQTLHAASITATATQTQTQTLHVAKPAAKLKNAMQPRAKTKPKPKPKRLDEVVESSIAGEIA